MPLYSFTKKLEGKSFHSEDVDAANDSVARELADIFASEGDVEIWKNGKLVASIAKK